LTKGDEGRPAVNLFLVSRRIHWLDTQGLSADFADAKVRSSSSRGSAV